MQIDEKAVRTYCRNKPCIALTIATHENGLDTIRSFGNDGVPIPPETRGYEIGSISKVFLSTFLAKCLEEGAVSLDDTIDRYIDLPRGLAYPSILQLATHTSGIVEPKLFNSVFEEFAWYFTPSKKQTNFAAEVKSDQLADMVAESCRKPRKNEGKFRYSNFGFSVVGYTLGKALGSSYHDYMTSYIENDLGLLSTSCNMEDLNMIHGFDNETDCGNWKWPEDLAYAPAGCLCAHAADALSFAKMNLYDEKSFLTLSHQERVSQKASAVGLGWMIERDSDIIWHNGRTGFFHSFLAFSKSKERAVVLLSNCPSKLGLAEDNLALSIMKSA